MAVKFGRQAPPSDNGDQGMNDSESRPPVNLPPLRVFKVRALVPNLKENTTELTEVTVQCHSIDFTTSGGILFVEAFVDRDGDVLKRYPRGFSGYVDFEEVPTVQPSSLVTM